MSSNANTNVACCTIPPVESDYTPKGSIESYHDYKCYVTGDSKKRTLVCIYDIFGIRPQTQQGADMLASSLEAKVYMPDFFAPDPPFPLDKLPPKNDQDKKDLQEFFKTTANVQKALDKLLSVGRHLRTDGFLQLAAYGFCWGGKVTMLAGSRTTFDAISIVHPAMLKGEDAKDLQVPLGLFPSKDEPADETEKILKIINNKPFASKNRFKLYPTMFHGWAAARADLTDPENKKEYADLYQNLSGFLTNLWDK